MRQQVGRAIHFIPAAAIDCLPEVLGVPVNYDRGEQIQPSHAEVLSFTCPVANFTLAPDAQSVLEGVMGFSFVQADLGTALHIGIQQRIDDEQRPFGWKQLVL